MSGRTGEKAIYRKVCTLIWCDGNFMQLKDDAKLLFLCLLTHPHQTALGGFRSTTNAIAAEFKWTLPKCRRAFTELAGAKMVEYCDNDSFISLPNFLKFNPPDNPNVVLSWGRWMGMIPECDGKNRLIERARRVVESRGEDFQAAFRVAVCDSQPYGVGNGLPNGSHNGSPNSPANGWGNREREHDQETEHDQEQEREGEERAPGRADFPLAPVGAISVNEEDPPGKAGLPTAKNQSDDQLEVDEIVGAWNALPDVLHIQKLTDVRKTSLRARLREPTFRDQWREAVDRISKSSFLRGQNDRDWKADFDWFIRPDSVIKIMEGKYADSTQSNFKRSSVSPGQRYMPGCPLGVM